MNEATIALIVMSVLIFLILVGFLVWGVKSGQFKNIEEAKYQMFRHVGKTIDKQAQEAPDDSDKKEVR